MSGQLGSQKKKIIILNHGLHIAGVSRALVYLCNALVEAGHDVTIKIEIDEFLLASELDERVRCELFLKEWRLFGKRIPGFLKFYYYFSRLFTRLPAGMMYRKVVGKGYDVEIGFNRGAALRIISASQNKKAKKLAWVHSDFRRCGNELAGFSSLRKAQKGYGAFDHIVCVSDQARISFQETIGDYDTLLTCPNLINFQKIRNLARAFSPAKSTKVLTAVGRVCEAKNYPMLLEATRLLNDRKVDFSVWIVGGGEELGALAQMVRDMRLDNVVLWDTQNNPYPYMAVADGYVCSSIYEGLSTTTIEALVLGKPCVVTDCTGMRDILGDSEYGLVVPITAEALADGMEKLLTDDALCDYYAKLALRRAEDFAPEKCLQRIEELFE